MPGPRQRRTADAAERAVLIVERRADRVPFREIARELGISYQRVHAIYEDTLARVPASRFRERIVLGFSSTGGRLCLAPVPTGRRARWVGDRDLPAQRPALS